MELFDFITAFFVSKKLSMVAAFVCWRPDQSCELWRQAAAAGVRLQGWPALPARGLRREGVLLDLACPGAGAVLQQVSSTRAFMARYSWLLLPNSSASAAAALAGAAVLPDADVTWCAPDTCADVYRIKPEHPLVVTPLPIQRSTTLKDLESFWSRWPPAVTRRKDLNNVYLKSVTVVTQPQHFKGWNDLTNRQIDTFPKLTYPLMMLLAEDLHFRHDLVQVALYGEERNGSFDGAAGLLQRRRAELGLTSMFLRADRWRALHFAAETVEVKGAFIFRQPAQSAVGNIFVRPLSRGVWAAAGGVSLLAALLLAAVARRLQTAHPDLNQLTLAECFSFAVAALCQQGFHVETRAGAARAVMVSALACSLFVYTAYCAKIVALLQTPSAAVRTLEQLARSPLALGVQDTTYKRVYFAVEQNAAYDVISRTFTEREKCGLQEIQAFKLPMVGVPLARHSGVRDLVATRLRWQREVGLMGRWRRHWLAERPRCDGGGGAAFSVQLTDVLPAIQALAAGAALAAALLAAEVALHAWRSRAPEPGHLGAPRTSRPRLN